MTSNRFRWAVTASALAVTLSVGACSAMPSQTQNSPTTTSEPGATGSTQPSATPTETTAATTLPGGFVNPNTASEQQIAAALEQHGVPDARRWASAIKTHAPYTQENAMGKLSQIVQEADLNLLDMGKVNEVFTW